MNDKLIYTLDRDRTYHFVTAVVAGLAVVVIWLATLLTPDRMVQELGSVATGRLLQLGWVALGGGPLVAWLWWSRRYVRRISWLPALQLVELEHLGYFGRRVWQLPVAAFVRHTQHTGHTVIAGAPTVDAPYGRLRVRGLPPLILDQQGTIHDADALAAILAGRSPEN